MVNAQQIPGWTSFNVMISSAIPKVTSIGHSPMQPVSPTEWSIVFTVMKNVSKMSRTLGKDYSVLILDRAIYIVRAKRSGGNAQWNFRKQS